MRQNKKPDPLSVAFGDLTAILHNEQINALFWEYETYKPPRDACPLALAAKRFLKEFEEAGGESELSRRLNFLSRETGEGSVYHQYFSAAQAVVDYVDARLISEGVKPFAIKGKMFSTFLDRRYDPSQGVKSVGRLTGTVLELKRLFLPENERWFYANEVAIVKAFHDESYELMVEAKQSCVGQCRVLMALSSPNLQLTPTSSVFRDAREAANSLYSWIKSTPRTRKRPSKQTHLQWQEWKQEGLSYQAIAVRHFDETGDQVSRDAVIKALKRLASA